MKSTLLIFAAIFILISCDKNEEQYATTEDFLGLWQFSSITLKNMDSIAYYPDSLEQIIWMEFISDSMVKVRGYCNYGGGQYILDGKSISFLDVGLTERGCDSYGVIWERYMRQIYYVNTYRFEDEQLILYTNDLCEFDMEFTKLDSLPN